MTHNGLRMFTWISLGVMEECKPLHDKYLYFYTKKAMVVLWLLVWEIDMATWGLDYRESEELSWCPSWSNSLWQGWGCGLVHCPGRNATDPIGRVLASSLGISSWTPLKPQHSNPNPLANQLWCIDFLTPPTPLIIPHRLLAFLESLMPFKNWCSIHARWLKSSLKHSICFCGIFFQV